MLGQFMRRVVLGHLSDACVQLKAIATIAAVPEAPLSNGSQGLTRIGVEELTTL